MRVQNKVGRGPLSQLSCRGHSALTLHTYLQYLMFDSTMFRSHLETGPAEFVELKIWASSESSPEFGRALSVTDIMTPSVGLHLQDRSRTKNERVVANSGRSSTPSAGFRAGPERWTPQATGPTECMFHGKVRARLRHSAGPALLGGGGRVAREVQNRWKRSQLFNSMAYRGRSGPLDNGLSGAPYIHTSQPYIPGRL